MSVIVQSKEPFGVSIRKTKDTKKGGQKDEIEEQDSLGLEPSKGVSRLRPDNLLTMDEKRGYGIYQGSTLAQFASFQHSSRLPKENSTCETTITSYTEYAIIIIKLEKGALATAASYPPMFNPLALIFVTFSEAIILGEPLTVGTVILVHGSFIFSLIAYCHIVAAICVAPFALYFERMTLTQGLFYYGMRDTSATYFVNFLNMKDSKEKMIGAIRKILGETREQQGLSENVKRKRKR
ncbi:hypothetical protein JHK85_025253 [Glycine max]|nr:hypothetical protein JHK85_025253 [Glycine max]